MHYLATNVIVESHEDDTSIDRRQIGTYYDFKEVLISEVKKLQNLGFKLLFYFDSRSNYSLFKRLRLINNHSQRNSSWKQLYIALLYKKTIVEQRKLPLPELTRLVMEQVLIKDLKLGIHFCEEGEADIGISHLCRDLNAEGQSAYIYSNDSDFAIMKDCRLIQLGELGGLNSIEYARVFTRAKVCSILSLTEEQVVEFAILLGTDFTELVSVRPDFVKESNIFCECLSLIHAAGPSYQAHPVNPQHPIQELILNYCRNFYNLAVTDNEAQLQEMVASMGSVDAVRHEMSAWDNIPSAATVNDDDDEEEDKENDTDDDEEEKLQDDSHMIPQTDVHALSEYLHNVQDQPHIESLGIFVLSYLSKLRLDDNDDITYQAVILLRIMISLFKQNKRVVKFRHSVPWEYAKVAYCYQHLLRHVLESSTLPYYKELQNTRTLEKTIFHYYDGPTFSWLVSEVIADRLVLERHDVNIDNQVLLNDYVNQVMVNDVNEVLVDDIVATSSSSSATAVEIADNSEMNHDDEQDEDLQSEEELQYSDEEEHAFTNAIDTNNIQEENQPLAWHLERLPVDNYTNQILHEINSHRVTLIRGDTGCGKSSRIPVIIAHAALDSAQPCRVLVCEPKQLAASALYARVSRELDSSNSSNDDDDGGDHHQNKKKISVALQLSSHDFKGPVDTADITYSATKYICKRYSKAIEQLSVYTHIIVDEVHERSFENDTLCLLLKTLLLRRMNSTLKVLLLSATVDYSLYRDYFSTSTFVTNSLSASTATAAATAAEEEEKHDTAVTVSTEPLYVGQTRFSCEFFHVNESSLVLSNPSSEEQISSIPLQEYPGLQTDTFKSFCETITRECNINQTVLKSTTIRKQMQITCMIIKELRQVLLMGHTVLIFVPSLTEISSLTALLSQQANDDCSNDDDVEKEVFDIFPIISDLTDNEQAAVMAEVTPHKIRIIIATKIAESSITLPSVKAVIDFGMDEVEVYDNNKNFTWQTRTNRWITKTSAIQRAGRAGRTTNGYIFRLYTEEQANYRFASVSECDTNCKPLHELILSALMCYNGKLHDCYGSFTELFSILITPPDVTSLNSALLHLYNAFLITSHTDTNSCQLTKLGEFVSYLPFGTHLGRLILYGVQFGIAHITVVLAAAIYKRIRPHRVPYCFNSSPDSFNYQMKRAFCSAWSSNMDGGRYSEPLMMLSLYRELHLFVHGMNKNEKTLSDKCYKMALNVMKVKAFVNLVMHVATTTKEAIAVICSEQAANSFWMDFNTSLHMKDIMKEPVKTFIYTALLWSSDGNILRHRKHVAAALQKPQPQSTAFATAGAAVAAGTINNESLNLFTLQVDTAVVNADKIKGDLFPYHVAGKVNCFHLKRHVVILAAAAADFASIDMRRFNNIKQANHMLVSQLITCRTYTQSWCNDVIGSSVIFAWMKDCLIVAAITTADPTGDAFIARVKSFLCHAVYASSTDNTVVAVIKDAFTVIPHPSQAGYSIYIWQNLPNLVSNRYNCVREMWRFGIKRYVELFSFPFASTIRIVIRTNGVPRFKEHELRAFCARIKLPLEATVDVSIPSFYSIDFKPLPEDEEEQTCLDAPMGFRMLNAYCIQHYYKRLMIHTKSRGNRRIPWFVAVEAKSVLTAADRNYQLPRYAQWEGLSQRPFFNDNNDGDSLEWQTGVKIDHYSYLATCLPFVENHDEVSAIASSVTLEVIESSGNNPIWICDQVTIVPYPACWLLAMMVIMSKGWLCYIYCKSEEDYKKYINQCVKIREILEKSASEVIYNDQELKDAIRLLQTMIVESNFVEKISIWDWSEDTDGLPEMVFKNFDE